MREGKHLLLLAVLVVSARCQQPKVSVTPNITHLGIYSGDLFYLRCESCSSPVRWYFNDGAQAETSEHYKITVAHPGHSGFYQCECKGQKSERFDLSVRGYLPHASLTIATGQPVMQTGGSVILHLENEGGLKGWNCWVYRGKDNSKKIGLRLKDNESTFVFQPNKLEVPETTFWCTDRNQNNRSNQVTVRTSGKQVSLEMYPLPAIAGENVKLRCLVWGTDEISQSALYLNDTEMPGEISGLYLVTKPQAGSYKCFAQFKYKAQTASTQHKVYSDVQYLYIQAPLIKAVLSYSQQSGMSCTCSPDYTVTSYHWYYKNASGWALVGVGQASLQPTASGSYACRAVWNDGRSSLSNHLKYESPVISSLTIVIIMLLILVVVVVGIYIWYRRRNTTGAIYEDVALRTRDKGDDKYEPLQKGHGAQKEAEYDTLHPEAAGREKKEGEYEPMKKEGMKEGVYHTLGTEGAAGGEGGYEALKKRGRRKGYTTRWARRVQREEREDMKL
ncbi:hypothetical protein Q5P01_023177 [Channa striata]|uniref:Ig-like domain-containing protein n=1 Tax=Channa striata TaxID=64152 RepID=A0AA88LKW2_CHASR|nr:hypothetical protein Q5P01_023177 [Channa striata]